MRMCWGFSSTFPIVAWDWRWEGGVVKEKTQKVMSMLGGWGPDSNKGGSGRWPGQRRTMNPSTGGQVPSSSLLVRGWSKSRACKADSGTAFDGRSSGDI